MISLTHDNDGYEELKNNLKLAQWPAVHRGLRRCSCASLPRCRVDAPALTCNCCRHFFERYPGTW